MATGAQPEHRTPVEQSFSATCLAEMKGLLANNDFAYLQTSEVQRPPAEGELLHVVAEEWSYSDRIGRID